MSETSQLDSSDIDEACRLHERATQLQETGQYKEAHSCCERALRIFEEVDGPDHPDVANVLNTLGEITRALGDYAAAEQIFRRSVGIMEDLSDDDAIWRIRIQSISNLATSFRMDGKYAEAETLFREALTLAESNLGAADIEAAWALNNLGIVCKYTGRFAEGLPLYQRALQIVESAFGKGP